MNFEIIQEIGSLLFKALELGIQYGPRVLEGLKNAWHWATTSEEITPEQQIAVRAAFEAAHAQVQAAGEAALQDAPDEDPPVA